MDPWILGVASSHNGGACLLRGSSVVAAIQEERLTRTKRAEHPGGSVTLSIRYCLEAAGLDPANLDAVVLCVAHPSDGIAEDISTNKYLRVLHHRTRVFKLCHHMGHAVGAYAMSGFDDATVLVVDGNGSPWSELTAEEQRICDSRIREEAMRADLTHPYRENISIYSARGDDIVPLVKFMNSYHGIASRPSGMQEFASLGDMYGFVGQKIFGSFLEGPGKVMGLAPYGTCKHPASAFYTFDGSRVNYKRDIPDIYSDDVKWPADQSRHADLAASAQKAIEEALAHLLQLATDLGVSSNLCYAGGVALNSVANELALRSSHFTQHFIMPAAEDSGTAIGAAFWGLKQLTGRVRSDKRQTVDSCGREYSDASLRATTSQLPFLKTQVPDSLASRAAQLLSEGRLIAWFQGGSEMGPRALGFRSILCDPRPAELKDVLNSKVKFRESFRPFAPVILEEAVPEWFDVRNGMERSPFMLRVLPFKEEKAPLVPAVVHVDGTGRVQTVGKDGPPGLRAVLEHFAAITGIPILLNTSFNIAGEPIVETPEDALWCFVASGLDCMVVGDTLVEKEQEFHLWKLTPTLIAKQIHLCHRSGSGCCSDLRCLSLDPRRAEVLSPDTDWNGAEPLTIQSVSIDQAWLLDERSFRLNKHHLRLITTTPWGECISAAPSEMLHLLRLCNGHNSISLIFESLCSQGMPLTERGYLSAILALLRARAITMVASSGQ